jgi:MarR family transcriptional regulator, organic hydroperoxide resistance regulator
MASMECTSRYRRQHVSMECIVTAPDLPALFRDLVRLQIELWNAVDVRLRADHELPLTWFEPLSVIARRPGCRVQDIAADLVITVGGTSKLVDRLEAAGYCRRSPHPSDGRSSLLELTDEGRAVQARASASYTDELQRRLGAALPAADLQVLAATLRRLRAADRPGSTS